jgi:plastocyanin domain-containing protein
MVRRAVVNRMGAEWIAAGSGLALISGHAGRLASAEPARQVRRVRINGSYAPAEIHVSAGAPVRLVFRREETARCSEHVVFPDFGTSAALPPFEDIAVDLPACTPGAHEFTCEMGILRGTLVVDEKRVVS